MSPHAILVRTLPGDHWECMCGRWQFDSCRALDEAAVAEVLRGEWSDHVAFEERYGG